MRRFTPTMRFQLESLESRRLLTALIVSSAADSGAGSLRAQIAAAAPSGDTISFAPGLAGQTITLTSGKLTIAKNLTIQGPGADQLTVSGNYQSGVFWISNSTNHVAIRGLTIADSAGGIVNFGVLTVSDSTFSGNTATRGGAICNSGTLNLSGSTLSGNSAHSGSVSYIPMGGAVYSNAGAVTIRNCTFFNNAALGSSLHYYDDSPNGYTVGFDAYGGAVYFEGTTASIDHSTFVGNYAHGGYGDPGYPQGVGYHGAIGGGQVSNSIVAGNYADYYFTPEGDFTSLGHNLIGNSRGVVFAASDLLDVNPQLGPLQNNGGPTQTMALLAGSPAINAGDNTNAGAYDQRGAGFPRIVGGTIDIGAFESIVGGKTWIGPISGGNWSTASNWSPSGVPSASDIVAIAGKSVNLTASATVAGLNLNDGATLTLAQSGNRVFRTSSLSISANSNLDLANNAMIFDYVGLAPLDLVRSQIASGRGGTDFANAPWNGPGINSSLASASDGISVAIGYADNALLPQVGLPSYTSFFGQTVDSTTILVRYTRGSDCNVDGVINSDDVTIIGANYNVAGTGAWFLGDFDYDGRCDSDDVTVLGALYNPTASPLASVAIAGQWFSFQPIDSNPPVHSIIAVVLTPPAGLLV